MEVATKAPPMPAPELAETSMAMAVVAGYRRWLAAGKPGAPGKGMEERNRKWQRTRCAPKRGNAWMRGV